MPEPREWISRVKEVEPPDLWEEAATRASSIGETDRAPLLDGGRTTRPATPRRAALVTGIVAGILTLAIVVLAIRTGPAENVGTPTPTPEVTSLSATHELLERLLSDLWTAEARLAELQSAIEAAHDELAALQDEIGRDPTDEQLLEIAALEERIRLWAQSAAVSQPVVTRLRERVDEVRALRAELLPPPDDGDYPDVATVTCDGDRTGGTHLSTPVVRMQKDGVHIRVVNRITNEQVFLVVEPDPRRTIASGATEDVVLDRRPPQDIEIVCTFAPPEEFRWARPSHPLWVAPALPDEATDTPTPEPTQLDPFLLTASLDEEPVAWPEVAFVPAGDAEEEIGYSNCTDCVLPVPSALAVDRDGSFWIADGLKARIAHFARDGSFIEAFPAEIGSALPVSEHAADLAFVGDRLYVLLEEGSSKVAPMVPGGLGEPIFVNNEGQRLHVEALIPGQERLLVLISGAEQLLGGYWAYATVDPATGQVTPSPGVQDSVGSYIDIQPDFDAPPGIFEIRWSQDGRGLTAIQEVRFQLVRNGQELRTTVGDTYMRTATQWGVATIVGMSNLQGTTGGRWYLEIVPESPQIVFERIPDDGFIGDARRYLTVGPDGHVYWMRLLEDGLHIYRR
jgi:hypothetical protein